MAPVSVSVLVASIAMLRSRLFPVWLCWLGLAAGIVASVNGVIDSAAFQAGGSFYQASQLLESAVLVAWLWMLATGVVLFRAAGRQRS